MKKRSIFNAKREGVLGVDHAKFHHMTWRGTILLFLYRDPRGNVARRT